MAEAKDDASKANPPVQQSAPAAPPDTAARLLAEEKAKALREAEEQRVRTIQEEEERRRASFGVYFETVLLEPMRREMMQKHARQVAISLKDRTGVSQCVNDETSCRRSISHVAGEISSHANSSTPVSNRIATAMARKTVIRDGMCPTFD